MTIRQLNKIMEIVMNGGVVIADMYHETYIDTHEITDDADILTLIDYGAKGYRFYIKEDDKPMCELEEIL